MVENVIQIKSGIDKCRCECKSWRKHHECKKDYIRNPSTCTWENGKYLESMIGDSGDRNYSNKKILYFTHLLINYHVTIDNR